jgi:hypothetical protein
MVFMKHNGVILMCSLVNLINGVSPLNVYLFELSVPTAKYLASRFWGLMFCWRMQPF